MSSDNYTMEDLKESEAVWKRVVAQGEMNLIKTYKERGELHLAYEKAENNSWIVKTLRNIKQRYKFDKCKNLVMIGSGVYPYSMFDVHKQYPHINQVGLEISKPRAILSDKLVTMSPAKDKIKIKCIDAIDYDYSWLNIDDLIFISVDVDHAEITNKILETSKAQLFMCAPYEKSWVKVIVQSSASKLDTMI